MTASTARSAPLRVREVTAAEHLAFLREQRPGLGASFLQTPAWGRVKAEWRHQSLGWFRASGAAPEQLVGVGLALYRHLPRSRRSLAYLPEGPVIDWTDPDLAAWLTPLTTHLRAEGAFGIRMGPPVITRRWSAEAVKDGIADDSVHRLSDLPAQETTSTGAQVVAQLRQGGWRAPAATSGFAAGQPQYNFVLPLRSPDGQPRSQDDVLAGMNQLWRRNIRKAAKAGVEVSSVSGAEAGVELKSFHDLYVHTAARDHFTPRPVAYFQTMVEALAAEDPERVRLWFARHHGDLVAATIGIRVGTHAWYSYGASSSEKREVRGSNAVQWAMICHALATGAEVYDLRGITDTLDASDPHVGLIGFKAGTGGEAVEYVGEWDLPLHRAWYAAFALYLRRRR